MQEIAPSFLLSPHPFTCIDNWVKPDAAQVLRRAFVAGGRSERAGRGGWKKETGMGG